MKPADIRQALGHIVRFTNRKLYLENVDYVFTGAIFRKNPKTGDYYYQAELTDIKNTHSVIICGLDDIEISKGAAP
jgi:hypothetical protein